MEFGGGGEGKSHLEIGSHMKVCLDMEPTTLRSGGEKVTLGVNHLH